MRFKKNIISLGAGSICSAKMIDGVVDFYIAGGGGIVKKSFDLAAHTLKTKKGTVAYASGYLPLEKGAAIDLGELVYEKYT